ncbi:hypothetical protein VTK73DRAFT_9084 [Phialemonium thermophilum]|uniref:NAD-dependent epimerase/dehydratase domain-containing protein n=1 Tax=Phialemonium thermophilum TaxID=223376 RepID=A0ABR3W4N7_9PEZI
MSLSPIVLVTGSAGHLGSALMYSLSSYGYSPIGLDILPCDTTNYVGSISDRAFVARVFAENPTIRYVLHTATLHKPHVGSHSKQDFADTNISGTLALLEEASSHSIQSFIFLSTTSAFGSALSPKPGQAAAWIDESVIPVPKNIYGATKVAAEDLCYLVHMQTAMPTFVLRTSRFFPEEDDDEGRRAEMTDENLKVCELAYRRVDIADVVESCVRAMERARDVGWAKYVISAPPLFTRDEKTLRQLDKNPAEAFRDALPDCEAVFAKKGWRFLSRIDRVYDSSKAARELDWRPQYTFERAIRKLAAGEEWRSALAIRVGRRGYHPVSTGVYTVR